MIPQASDNLVPPVGESEFLELVCRYLDNDELSREEWTCLNGQLREDRARRETFVRLCLQAKLIAEGLPIGDPLFPLEAEPREGIALTNVPLATSAPTVSLFGGPALNARGYFPERMLFSYLAATVLFALALLVGSFITVSPPAQVVQVEILKDVSPPPLPDRSEREPALVGRITRMVNCRWAGPTVGPPESDGVPLGSKFALASGFMEITYNTGAKVILEGPVAYEVESATGGFLSRGKLTARVDEKGAGVRDQGPGSKGERTANLTFSQTGREPTTSLAPRPLSGKSEIRNPKSEIADPSPLAPRPSPLFSVRTPTAVVTDLGTEFGVEVGKAGITMSHVFRGVVRVQLVGDNGRTQDVVLRGSVGLRRKRQLGWRRASRAARLGCGPSRVCATDRRAAEGARSVGRCRRRRRHGPPPPSRDQSGHRCLLLRVHGPMAP